MPAAMTPKDVLADLARRGFTVRAVGGAISVVPASGLTHEDRQSIRERRAALLAILAPTEPWDTETALRLMEAADALVERLGLNGRHPAVAASATRVGSAYAARDLETVRFAVTGFVALVRRLAAGAIPPPSKGE